MISLREVKNNKLSLNLHVGQTWVWECGARFIVMLTGTQALSLNTSIPTQDGFIPMSKIKVGTKVFGIDGKLYSVTQISPVFSKHDCYKVTFDDGSEITCDSGHLWRVQSRKNRKNSGRRVCEKENDYQILTTEELYGTWNLKDNIKNYSIDLPFPVCYPEKLLPIPPYLLGAWLGDGTTTSSHITNSDPELIEHIKEVWGTVKAHAHSHRSTTYCLSNGRGNSSNFANALKALGCLGRKRIPSQYLIASYEQRLELLKGLLDTDGYCSPSGIVEFYTILPDLAQDVLELVRSLGIKARCKQGVAKLYGRVISDKYRITFQTDLKVFKLSRKLERQKKPLTPEYKRLFIAEIKKIDTVPTKCIVVDSIDHLYLASKSYIPTHNSGKTSLGVHWLHREIQRCGAGDYLAVTATFPLLNLKMLPEFLLVFRDILHLGEFKESTKTFEISPDGEIKLFGAKQSVPTRIIFASATNPESIESATAKAAWLDEAGQKQFRRDSWEAVRRRLSIHRGRALFTTTLYGLGWLKTEIFDKAEKYTIIDEKGNILPGAHRNTESTDKDIQVISFDSILNPAFPRDEYEAARKTMPSWKFDLFYRGRYSRPAGLIYDSFNEKVSVIPRRPIDMSLPCYVGHDFGSVNMAAVFYQLNPSTGEYTLYRTYKAGGKSTAEHVRDLQELSKGENIIQRVGGNHQEDGWRGDFTKAGWTIIEPNSSLMNHHDVVERQIDMVYALHKLNKIFVFSDLYDYLDEKLSFSRELSDNYEPTEKIENEADFHFMAAERYILSHFHPQTLPKTRNIPTVTYCKF